MAMRQPATQGSIGRSILVSGALFTVFLGIVLAIGDGGLDLGVIFSALVGGLVFGALMALCQRWIRANRST